MSLHRFLPLLLLVAFGGRSLAESLAPPAEERVFVCAHSFMIFTAKMLPPLAKAAGVPFTAAGQQMLGGSRVIQHWNLPDERNQAKV
jgi:hypothetical protein